MDSSRGESEAVSASTNWPSEEMFDSHMMKSWKEVEELRSFLRSREGQPFILIDEAKRYCEIDVKILAIAALCLEKEMLESSGFEISMIRSSTMTLASLSAVFYRQRFMPEGALGLFPTGGYRQDRQSREAEGYFAFVNQRLASHGLPRLSYRRNTISGEMRVGGHRRLDATGPGYDIEYDNCWGHSSRLVPQKHHPHY